MCVGEHTLVKSVNACGTAEKGPQKVFVCMSGMFLYLYLSIKKKNNKQINLVESL